MVLVEVSTSTRQPTPSRAAGWAGVVGSRSDLRAQRACLLFYRKSAPPELPMDRQAGRQDALSSNNALSDASGDELPSIYDKVVIEYPGFLQFTLLLQGLLHGDFLLINS